MFSANDATRPLLPPNRRTVIRVPATVWHSEHIGPSYKVFSIGPRHSFLLVSNFGAELTTTFCGWKCCRFLKVVLLTSASHFSAFSYASKISVSVNCAAATVYTVQSNSATVPIFIVILLTSTTYFGDSRGLFIDNFQFFTVNQIPNTLFFGMRSFFNA